MTRYAIIAPTIAGNRGAEAMLETTVGRVRDIDPDASFAFYSYMPKTDARLVSAPFVTIHSAAPAYLVFVLFPASLLLGLLRVVGLMRLGMTLVPRSVKDLAGCVALFDLAGVSFIDGREKFLPFNLLTLWPAMLLGVPVIKLSQAMGPFEHPLNRVAARTLWNCRMVVPRGEGTVSHLRGAKFPESTMYPAPDVAFGFEERYALSSEGASEVEKLTQRLGDLRASGSLVLGLCPSSVIASKARSTGWDYIGFLADITSGLAAQGITVLLFPNATRADSPDKYRNNDLPVIAEVTQRLAGASTCERVLAVTGDVSAVQIRRLVLACDAVAVSRFHAMVGALATEVPVLVLGWSHKYAEVMKDFGLSDWVFDYADQDTDAFLKRCHELLEQREELAAAIADRLPSVRAASTGQFDEAFRRLGSS